MTDWDWDSQKAETLYTISSLEKENAIEPGEKITLDLEFVPMEDAHSDKAALVKALKSFGYDVETYDDDATVTASHDDVPFTAEAIWTHEERTTTMALSRGYKPDGWGFWDPDAEE